ncbi:MAG: TrmJ/YjtD family RNA methyltransferase [Gemmatimonadetes bacterium]|nr:TrmJ/YjtD family RNA methyltransferase [Gemmatimonadota bacterium]
MSLVIVLHRPQDLVNIASVIRIMKNFALRDLRLVAPAEYDAYRVEGIAHQTGDVLKRVQVFEALDPALADCHQVVGFTARQRSAKRNAQRPREAVGELLAMSEATLVALVFGPEDQGLTNDELDRCHRIVTIPTSAEYPSLNLAQAVAVMAYELFLARGTPPLKPPRRAAEPARQEQLERLFGDARAALEAIDFFKTRRPEAIMRTVREVIHRTPFDAREVELARAMCIEVVRYLRLVGRSP